jgi:hypothetical protein
MDSYSSTAMVTTTRAFASAVGANPVSSGSLQTDLHFLGRDIHTTFRKTVAHAKAHCLLIERKEQRTLGYGHMSRIRLSFVLGICQ